MDDLNKTDLFYLQNVIGHDMPDGIRFDVERWVELAEGEFTFSDIMRDLNYVYDPDAIVGAKVVIKELVYHGVLKQHKTRNGVFRKLKAIPKKMAKVENRPEPLDIWLPLGLHHKVIIEPGSLIIVAGVSNAGKSAFMLNFTEQNMNAHKIRYVTSEWANAERDGHLEDFGVDIDEWDAKVDFIAKKNVSDSFDSYIDPELVNVIDYYESYDSYGAIAGDMRDIADKLTTGIAIVAMQKKGNSDHAYGGEGTVNRAQLYINLDYNSVYPHKRIATIRKLKKARNRRYSIERLSCEYEYSDKGRIVSQSQWGIVTEEKSKGLVIDKFIEPTFWANRPPEEESISWVK